MWRFDGFVLDTQRYELRRDDDVVRVEPQVFDVLTQLVGNHERCVTKEELFDSVWGGRFVGEAALTSRIKAAQAGTGRRRRVAALHQDRPRPRVPVRRHCGR